MPTPTKRQPKSAPPAEPALGGGLPPSPDNGVPLAENRAQAAAKRPAASRRGRQLGLRVPEEVAQRLDEVSTSTGISRQRLLVDALTEWLKRYDD